MTARADYVDFIFFDLDFSMSLDDPNTVRLAVAMADAAPVNRPSDCPLMGRIFYLAQGERIGEANLYFSPGCTYLDWLEEGKPVRANVMSAAGKNLLNTQFRNLIPNYQIVE